MKISKDNLVKLVLSLSARERQEFKEMHSGNYDYLELFNHICKNKGFDEQQFTTKLLAQKKESNSGGSGVVNLSLIRSYLLDKLLNSLRSSHKTPLATVYLNLTYSDILMSNGLDFFQIIVCYFVYSFAH